MGTRLLFGTRLSSGGQTVQLKHKGMWLGGSEKRAISGQVSKAAACVRNSITAINGGSPGRYVTELAKEYFVSGPSGLSKQEWLGVVAILELTSNGLSANFTLKLKGDGDFGFVTRHEVAAGTAGSFEKDGGHWTRDGHSIHVSKKQMLANAELGVVTLIHEATHKFANTSDHGNAGYREEDDSGWWEPGLTKAQALVNADGIAYFAYRAGSVIRI